MNESIKKIAKPVMVQGTSSNAGKSIITASLCRIFKDMGLRVAPFKAQNMALNSFVTEEGGEIGRAQAFQAEAAGITPTVDMNPVLLKPSSESLSQVIIQGKVYGNMSAREYHDFKKIARQPLIESYLRLAEKYDVIVIEGAGSPAEINLRDGDIANMGMAEIADSPVMLVGNIELGGVFASFAGTMELLTKDEKKRIKGFIINKFRGDIDILYPAIEFIKKRTGRAVLGVVPYIRDLDLPEEDGVSLGNKKTHKRSDIKISVIRLPRISNFTDFDPFREEGVFLNFAERPSELAGSDAVIIPGTKNTLEDLLWLRKNGFEDAIGKISRSGGAVFGICGGFQMLGRVIRDPFGVESGLGEIEGLSLLAAETVLMKEKKAFQVLAEATGPDNRTYPVRGYEIHMGATTGINGTCGGMAAFARIKERNSSKVDIMDGGISRNKNVWGTYIHGIFDNDSFRSAFIRELKRKKGIFEKDDSEDKSGFRSRRESSISSISDTVRKSLDIGQILKITGL